MPDGVDTVPEKKLLDCAFCASETLLPVGGLTSKLLNTIAVTGSKLVTLHVKVKLPKVGLVEPMNCMEGCTVCIGSTNFNVDAPKNFNVVVPKNFFVAMF